MLRLYKRLLIGLITLIVLGVPLVYFAFTLLSEPESTCVDNIQNQNEEGIDCGGDCPFPCPIDARDSIEVASTHILPIGQNVYDIAIRVRNPDLELGMTNINYTLAINDITGEPITILRGRGFLLPKEEFYIIAPAVQMARAPGSASVMFDDITWGRPVVDNPQFEIINSVYQTLPAGSIFASEATGVVRNNSTFGFDSVTVSILLSDERGDLISIATSEVNTLLSGEARFFKVTWPGSFTRQVNEVQMIPRTNTLDEQNILRPPPEEEFNL